MFSLYPMLGSLEKNTLWDTVTKEVVGINAPKIAFTRTRDELIDSATSEIGNTVTAFGLGGLLHAGLGKLFGKIQARGGRAAQWAILGRSGALYSSIFALMWAMPFARNYLTTLRTGKLAFKDVINKEQPGQAREGESIQSALAAYRRKIGEILGLGLAATATFTLGGYLAARKGLGLGVLRHLVSGKPLAEQLGFKAASLKKALNGFSLKDLLLKNGSFFDFSGLKAVLFWGIPAYAGWMHASRDPYERKEQLLKFAAFVLGFSGPQLFTDRHFQRKFKEILPEGVESTWHSITGALEKSNDPAMRSKLNTALSLWKRKNAWSLLTSIFLLGSLPPVLNIFLTQRRLARAQALQPVKTQPTLPAGNLKRKSFAEWGRR